MTINLDMSFFSVVCDLKNCLYTPETELDDMTFQRIVSDIRGGQLENVQAILEYNPSEGWSADVTEDVMTAAFAGDGPPDTDSHEENWSDYSSERIEARLAGVRWRSVA